jgi:oligopeptidase B
MKRDRRQPIGGSIRSLSNVVAGAVILALLALPVVAEAGGAVGEEPSPPMAKRMAFADTMFGDVRVDYYHWLRNRDDPAVVGYLDAENAYTEAMTSDIADFHETIYQEMLSHIKETDLSVPYLDNGYYYYRRTEEGLQYPIICRKKGSLEAEEEVLLDENELAEGHDFYEIWAMRVSPDNTKLAYCVDTAGNEIYTLYVKDLGTGELLPDVITKVDYALEWANDSSTLFYATMDESRRPDRLWRHSLGTDRSEDHLVYYEEDPGFSVWIDRTRSDRFLVMSVGSWDTEEEYFLDADDPKGVFELVEPREEEVEYYISHHGDDFFIRTNEGALNYKVMRAPIAAPSKDNWVEFIPPRDDVTIERIEAFAGYLVVLERAGGVRRVRVVDLDGDRDHFIEFPEPVYSVALRDNREYDTRKLRFAYESYTTPESIYDYDVGTRERTLLKQREVLGDFDASRYQTERLFATAEDGVEVPISLVYRRDARLQGGNPVYLVGYGAYGSDSDPYFSSGRLSLLDRGVIYATAQVRGGGEMGEEWHEEGKLLNKRNTFTDFIACSERLIEAGYAAPDGLVAVGGSAGGLLVGAVVNMRPDLYRAVVADVPFVDTLNTMLDASLPLTVGEYDEWGNPNEEQYYWYIKSYSPYDNVGAYDYPDMYVTASLNDQRVQYWEPAKWVAKLRANKVGDGELLLRTNMGAGHGGSSGRYDWMREWALEYAVVLDWLGLRDEDGGR